MTEVLAPPVGEMLTAETVKLLVKGDVLKVCTGRDEAGSLKVVDRITRDGRIKEVGDGWEGYFPDCYTFLARPSLAAPTVQGGGQDDCLLPPQEASVPVVDGVDSASLRRALADYDANVAECRIDGKRPQRDTSLPCDLCAARTSESCGRKVSAAYGVVSVLREALDRAEEASK